MKKSILILTIFAVIIFSGIVLAESSETNYTVYETWGGRYDFSHLQVQQIKYEPYPVNPGEYFTMWVKIENTGNIMTKDAVFELMPKYPFSFDSNEEPIRRYGQIDSEPIVLEYKVRVDKDAVEGRNEIDFRYKDDTVSVNDAWASKTFDIEIADAQTDFDFVIQEINGNDISIALANTGKNEAYSVIVRVPEQDIFEVVGTDGQMVGNLANGDYTLVGFTIQKKPGIRESGNLPLEIEIDYTDTLGERRKLIKTLQYRVEPSNFSGMALPDGASRQAFLAQRNGTATPQTAIYQQWWFWLIILGIFIVVWKSTKAFIKYREAQEEKRHQDSKRNKK